jgi:CRP-like cAMP-binding protein
MFYCSLCQASHTFCIQQQINDHKPVISLQFNEGELIFDEEQQLRGIYFIKSGVCKISKMSANGKEQIIHFLGEGTLLGIRSILNEETTNLKARALTKATDDRIVIMGQNKMVQRLAHFLIKIHDDFGEDTLGNLKLYLKREDMASYIGVTIESTIRMLKVFERKGLILIQGKTLKILDIGELKNISKGFSF